MPINAFLSGLYKARAKYLPGQLIDSNRLSISNKLLFFSGHFPLFSFVVSLSRAVFYDSKLLSRIIICHAPGDGQVCDVWSGGVSDRALPPSSEQWWRTPFLISSLKDLWTLPPVTPAPPHPPNCHLCHPGQHCQLGQLLLCAFVHIVYVCIFEMHYLTFSLSHSHRIAHRNSFTGMNSQFSSQTQVQTQVRTNKCRHSHTQTTPWKHAKQINIREKYKTYFRNCSLHPFYKPHRLKISRGCDSETSVSRALLYTAIQQPLLSPPPTEWWANCNTPREPAKLSPWQGRNTFSRTLFATD